jgi:hypothetical protein
VVRVLAAGVNFLDVGQRRGTYPRQVPFTLGVEGAGMVESAGEGVRNVKPSDRAAFTGMPSAYSEAILADADRLIPLPNEFTFQEGAAFPRQLGSEPVFGRALCDLIRRRLVWDCALPSRVSDPVSVSQPAAIRSTGLALKDQRAYRRNFQEEIELCSADPLQSLSVWCTSGWADCSLPLNLHRSQIFMVHHAKGKQ